MTAVACDITAPLTVMLPITVTVKSVVTVTVVLHDRVDVPGEGRTALANGEQLRPVEGDADNATLPVRPFTEVTVIVCSPATPLFVFTVTGAEGAIVKSTTWYVMTAVV